MTDDGRRDGWILVLAVLAGMALGAWLALQIAGRVVAASRSGEPSANAGSRVDLLQVVQAFASEPPLGLPAEVSDRGSGRLPRLLMLALPTFPARQRVLFFIRPAEPSLCRSLHGTELATYWDGAEPTGLCAVGDPLTAGS